MEIKINVLDRQYMMYQEEYESKALEVLRSGYYVLGPQVKGFEHEFANFVGTKHCVGLANGLDALWIGVRLLGIGEGDEVLVQANTYIATVMGITMNNATPVFVEPNAFHNMTDEIEHLITPKTKAVLVTHLYGQATKMDEIVKICKKHGLYLIEDCAQAHGATYKGQQVGSFGDLGCFSFYPSKNLGCFGDGGAITTNNDELADAFRTYRNYGSKVRYYNDVIGTNSRLDEFQAGMLRVKLSHLNELTEERVSLAHELCTRVSNPWIELPLVDENCTSVWHLFVVRTKHREELMKYLEEHHVQTLIHYPIPPHMQKAYEYLGHHEGDYPISENLAREVLTLPLYNGMKEEELNYLIDVLNGFTV